MATYDVAQRPRKVQLQGNGTTGPFQFTFQIESSAHIKVYLNDVEKQEGTGTGNYQVTINADGSGGSVSFTADPSHSTSGFPTSSDIVTLISDIPLSRTSIYTSGGDLTAQSLESDFDTSMFIHQQTNEEIDRSIRLPEHDTVSSDTMILPSKANRLGKTIGFHSTTGALELKDSMFLKVAGESFFGGASTNNNFTFVDVKTGLDQKLLITGAGNVNTTVGRDGNDDVSVSISVGDATFVDKGIANYSSTYFSLSQGTVSLRPDQYAINNIGPSSSKHIDMTGGSFDGFNFEFNSTHSLKLSNRLFTTAGSDNYSGMGIVLNEQNEDFFIEINDGGVAKYPFVIDASIPRAIFTGVRVDINNGGIRLRNTSSSTGASVQLNAHPSVTGVNYITFPNASGNILLEDGSGNVNITGNLTVNGTTTTVNTATLSVEDPLIALANGNNSADSVDIGFYGLYDTSGSQDLYAGLFRDATDDKFKLFKNLQTEPTSTVNISGTGYTTATLVSNIEGNVTGNLTGNVTGNVTGNLTGNVTGNTTGIHTGNVTGNITGNLTGNVTGAVTTKTSTGGVLELQRSGTSVSDNDDLGFIRFTAPDVSFSSPTVAGTTSFEIMAEATADYTQFTVPTKLSFRATDQLNTSSNLLEVFSINPDGSASLPVGGSKLRFHSFQSTSDEVFIGRTTNSGATFTIRNSASPLTDLDFTISYEADAHFFKVETGGGATPTYDVAFSINKDVGTNDDNYIKVNKDYPLWIEDNNNGVGSFYIGSTFVSGNRVNTTASELNKLDGSAKSTSSITIDDADAFIIIDGNTTKQIPASDLKTYIDTTLITSGVLSIKNTGSQSQVRLYCESNNAHYVALQAPAHSQFQGNPVVTLPAGTGTLLSDNSEIGDLLDVNTSGISDGQVLQYNSGQGRFNPATISSGSSGVTVQDEGSALSTDATTLNFVGAGVTASGTGTTKTITIAGGSDGVTVQDEGSALSTTGTTLNFVGSGVVASGTGATKTITITGGGSGGTTSTSYGASLTGKLSIFQGTANTIVGSASINSHSDPAPNIANTALYNTLIGNRAGVSITTGDNNTNIGNVAGDNISTGSSNVCVGSSAGSGPNNNLSESTYVGVGAGYSGGSADGNGNTAIGHYAMYNTSSYVNARTLNVAIGKQALDNLRTGDYNTSIGVYSDCYYNNSQYNTVLGYLAKAGFQYNVSIGHQAGSSMYNQTDNSILIGYRAGYDMDGGDDVVFIGHRAGYAGGSNWGNTGIGSYAVDALTSGYYNTGVGFGALSNVSSGNQNTGLGVNAGEDISTGDNNTAIGFKALGNTSSAYTGDNNICIGYLATPSSTSVSNEITLGNSDIATLRCQVTSITALSDQRDKTAIEDLDLGLDFIKAMKPRKFAWNRRDGKWHGKKEVGFIAQELHEVEMDFNSTDRTRLVNYENPSRLEAQPMNTYPILIKAIQELSAKVDSLQARINKLEGEK